MHRGYVKLRRYHLDGLIRGSHKQWKFYTYCLLKASHQGFNAVIGHQTVPLMPGQCVIGLRVASQETRLTIREVRTCIKSLSIGGFISVKTTNKFSIISIIDWDISQNADNENDKQVSNKCQTSDKQVATYKNIRMKEYKNKKYSDPFINWLKLKSFSEKETEKEKEEASCRHEEREKRRLFLRNQAEALLAAEATEKTEKEANERPQDNGS